MEQVKAAVENAVGKVKNDTALNFLQAYLAALENGHTPNVNDVPILGSIITQLEGDEYDALAEVMLAVEEATNGTQG